MKSLAVAVALWFAAVAVADERYVPLGGGRSRTEVRIVNASEGQAAVEIELLGRWKTRAELGPGESVGWSEAVAEPSVLRISGHAALQVTAVSHSAAATASVPVVPATHTVGEASAAEREDAQWRSAIVVINPHHTAAVVLLDGAVQVLAPDGVLRGRSFRSETPLLVFTHDVHEETGASIFTPHATARKRRAVRSVTPVPAVQSVTLTPSKDNTLYESTTGGTSNGAGPHIFAGTTQSRSRRRALLAFDVASQVPPGSRITRVTLAMRVSMTISGDEPVALHRVTAEWGEGASNAGGSRDGDGTAARAGDATWLHTFFPDRRWSSAGGDFQAAADATTLVGTSSGVWESAAMIARVQQWLDQPGTNFGWIAIGEEGRSATAKRFDSREVQTASSRPALTVEFRR